MSISKQTSKPHTIKQVVGGSSILIDAKLDNSQTMVKLCKNGNEWLSPTGWSKTEKSTLLDSQAEGDLTAISIPENFATDIVNGDRLNLRINSANFDEALVWQSPNAAPKGDTSSEKRGLFSRFSSTHKDIGNVQSEIEKLATQAREAAAVSSVELHRAHEAKCAAEERALEAARLAELANKLEQERIAAVKEAERALIKAEAARLAEEKRIEAERLAKEALIAEEARLVEVDRLAEVAKREQERLAEEARLAKEAKLAEAARLAEAERLEKERQAEAVRLAQEAKLAEIARRESAVQSLEIERRNLLKALEGKREETCTLIAAQETKVLELAEQAKKAKAAAGSQKELEEQAKRTIENAQNRLSDREANFEACLKAEQAIKDELSQVERILNEQKKQFSKSAQIAQKVQSQYEAADATAKAAARKALELQAAARTAQDAAKSLQRDVAKLKQQAEDAATQKSSTMAASTSARDALDAIKTTLGSAKTNLEHTQERMAQAGNLLGQTDSLIQSSKTELQQFKVLEENIRTEEERLKAQQITLDNVDELAGLASPKLNVPPIASMPKDNKLAALASGHGARIDSTNVLDTPQDSDVSHRVMTKLKSLLRHEQTGGPNPLENLFTGEEGAPKPVTLAEKPVVKPVVKLVSETPAKDLPKPSDEDVAAAEHVYGNRKKLMGMSAVLLASVAGIGIIVTNGSKVDQTQTVSTQTKRVSSEAVLPATVSIQSDGTTQLAHDVTAEKTTQVETVASSPVKPQMKPQSGAQPNLSLAEIARREIATLQTPKAEVAATVQPKAKMRGWGDGQMSTLSQTEKPALRASRSQRSKTRAKTVRKKPTVKRRAVKRSSITQRASLSITPRTSQKPIVTVPDAKIFSTSRATYRVGTNQPRYSDVTKDVQNKLKDLGFYQGPVSGLMDAETKAAMHTFQDVFALPKSDRVTTQLIAELSNAGIVQPAKPQLVPKSIPSIKPMAKPAPEPKIEASVAPNLATITSPKTSSTEPVPAPELVVEAKKISAKSARYPSMAARRGHDKDAIVVVRYDVDTDGNVVNAVAANSDGVGPFKVAFEKEAIRAVTRAKFNPKTINGKSVVSKNRETKFTFNIE